jgi:hypothetical protein
MFAQADRPMPPDDLISHAADLAEALVEAVSSPAQDWQQIEEWALELAALARRAAAGDGAGP